MIVDVENMIVSGIVKVPVHWTESDHIAGSVSISNVDARPVLLKNDILH